MKKIISLILTVCLIFVASNIICTDVSSDGNESSKLNLHSLSEFALKLECENVDSEDSNAYEISILIELEDIEPTEDFDFSTQNI